MKLPDLFGGGSKSSASSFNPGDIIKATKMGVSLGRSWRAGIIKRQLKTQGYDPITIASVVAAVKAGEDFDGILATADQAKIARDQANEIRRNPPPVHGSAAWAQPARSVVVCIRTHPWRGYSARTNTWPNTVLAG